MARAIDQQIPAIWMVRTFLKHADESEDDEDLREVVRGLYDFILALGPLDESTDLKKYLKAAKKKRSKLKKAAEFYAAIQPEVSGHTNFEMAAKSLNVAVARIEEILARKPSPQATPSS
ncbi:MAG: amidohydrolase [Planctomycetota bacterium]